MAKMTTAIRLDFDKNLIILNSTFAKKARRIGSPEYNQLQEVHSEFSTFKVVQRQIKKKTDQEHYKGLTYDYMRAYITENAGKEGVSDEDWKAAVKEALDVLENKIFISKCHSNTQRYPAIKNWFLATYPEVKEVFKNDAA